MFYFIDGQLLVDVTEENAELPNISLSTGPSRTPAVLPGVGEVVVARDLFLGTLDGRPCRTVELRPVAENSSGHAQQGEGPRPMGLRSLMGRRDEELLRVAGVASQILDWDRNHQFCGRCGARTVPSDTERSRSCPTCFLTAYPRISPAIIVAVVKGDRLLLGHNRRHRGGHVFSVLAGFVEPGESLEECVRREVMEEVAIEVKNIRYFASQPWPFPDSLMIAFTATYGGGEIAVDGTEIIEAGWFDRDHLPSIPPHGTVARRLIDWFADGGR
jgi:NAD+ diphosphatase